MSKKNFIALADALKGLKVPKDVLQALIRFCHEQNSRFKSERWLAYLRNECGPNGGTRALPSP